MTRAGVEPLDTAVEGRPRYVKVAVNSGRPTYLTFSYSVPADREIVPGEVVHAPFGRQTLQGIVVDGPVDTPGYDPSGVRPLEPALEGAPRVTPERMALAGWLQEYYLAPPWEAHAVFLPPGAGERPERAGREQPVAVPGAVAAAHDLAAPLVELDQRAVVLDDGDGRHLVADDGGRRGAALQALLPRCRRAGVAD